MATETITICTRCGVRCLVNPDRNEAARLLRRSKDTGVCANCAITLWLKETEPLASLIAAKGPECLLDERVAAQVGLVLAAANSDADSSEIAWPTVVSCWGL